MVAGSGLAEPCQGQFTGPQEGACFPFSAENLSHAGPVWSVVDISSEVRSAQRGARARGRAAPLTGSPGRCSPQWTAANVSDQGRLRHQSGVPVCPSEPAGLVTTQEGRPPLPLHATCSPDLCPQQHPDAPHPPPGACSAPPSTAVSCRLGVPSTTPGPERFPHLHLPLSPRSLLPNDAHRNRSDRSPCSPPFSHVLLL